MKVHRELQKLPAFKKAVVTIGTFDGVHTGHLQIINQLKEEAAAIGGETVIITFDPHPRMVLQQVKENGPSNKPLLLLNTLAEKILLLEKQSIDHLVVVPFNLEFAEQTAEDYITKFLSKRFHPHTIIIGYDHHFGKSRKGNYKLLEEFAGQENYKVKEIPEHVLNNVAISSTNIRASLLSGNTDLANSFLGYRYFFSGTVVQGDKIGRTIGYPTANISMNDKNKLVPADGVYAVQVILENDSAKKLDGMMSIGIRPTIGGVDRMIEVNIFDFDREIYGKNLEVHLVKYLRPEIKFDTLHQLQQQIGQDKNDTLKVMAGL